MCEFEIGVGSSFGSSLWKLIGCSCSLLCVLEASWQECVGAWLAWLLAVSHNFFDRLEGLVVLLVACCDRGAL